MSTMSDAASVNLDSSVRFPDTLSLLPALTRVCFVLSVARRSVHWPNVSPLQFSTTFELTGKKITVFRQRKLAVIEVYEKDISFLYL